MNLTRPLYSLAIAAAVVFSLATQVYAQAPENVAACEAFTAAIEAQGNATIVSGIDAEEAVFEQGPLGFVFGSFDDGEVLSGQGVAVDTPQLTIPSGTLTPDEVFGVIPAETFFSVQGNIGGAPVDVLFFIDPVDFLQPPTTLVFEPNPDLGDACGFCLTTIIDPAIATPGALTVDIYDGDTLIAQRDFSTGDLSFIAEPGQTFTRVEFPANGATDISVAFCEDPVSPPEVSNQECLAALAAEIGELADAATDPCDAYLLNVASCALNFSAKDRFYEEDGNRLSRKGCNVFTGAAYAICYLEHAGVDGTEEIVDSILEKLEQIVDDEIDYAIANGGRPDFIECAEDYAELAEWIDEDLDNPVVATIAYKLAWAHAYFATY